MKNEHIYNKFALKSLKKYLNKLGHNYYNTCM